jgi:aminoglycoside phosphotransferase (APT) family kinase protein
VATEPLAWDEVAARLARVLGEPVHGGLPLTPGRSSRTTWAAHGQRAGPLCARIRRWLQPVWGLRLPPSDYAHNDLNLSNILTDGDQITGVVDWDEFGLGSRALDLVVLALDCQERGAHAAAHRLLSSAASAAGSAGLRCLVSYRALAALAENTREGQASHAEIQAIEAVLTKLRAPGD